MSGARVTALGLAVAVALGGCGLGPGAGAGGASLSVTRDFGATSLGAKEVSQVPEGETVMRLLQRSFEVGTRFGGNFVQSIGGLASGSDGGTRADWFFYVNGIEAGEGATAIKLSDGDRVWWDHHRWDAAMRIPAVVGSYPEPFRSGSDGRRRPVRLDCGRGSRPVCDQVADRMNAAGVPAVSQAAIGAPAGIEILRVIVGPWTEVRRDPTAKLLEDGPQLSGVYARPARDGKSITLLDARGKPVRELGAGDGLIGATRYQDQQPTWIVTGVDEAGLAAAAGALEEGVLKDRFALAVEGGRGVPLPVAAK